MPPPFTPDAPSSGCIPFSQAGLFPFGFLLLWAWIPSPPALPEQEGGHPWTQTPGARGLPRSPGPQSRLFLLNTPHIVCLCVLFPVPELFQLHCPGSLQGSLAKQGLAPQTGEKQNPLSP